jgi:hypothetical protein
MKPLYVPVDIQIIVFKKKAVRHKAASVFATYGRMLKKRVKTDILLDCIGQYPGRWRFANEAMPTKHM